MNRWISILRNFYQGYYYPIFAAFLIFLGHATGQELIFGAILVINLILALLICDDLRFAILPATCVIFTVSVGNYTPSNSGYGERYLTSSFLITSAVFLSMLVAAVVFFIWKNRRNANPFPAKSMFWSMLVLCVAFCFNGLFSQKYTFANAVFILSFIGSLLVIYVLFALFVRFDASTFRYFMYCLTVAGLLIAAELIFAFFTTVQFENGQIVKGSVLLGWGVWTNVGGMLSFLMPACFYFAYAHKHGWIGYLLGFFEYFCIVLSQSRGALLVGTVILVLCLLMLCLKGNNRKQNRIFTLCVAGCGIIVFLLLSDRLLALVQNFLEYGFADNGRYEKWAIGWSHFLENPMFGSGFYDSYTTTEWDMGIFPYLYHNTPIQLLGATGIVGTLAYAYHRFETLKLVFVKPNHQKSFLGLCILSLLLFSLTDVLFFKTYPTIFYSLMLLFMEHSALPVHD